MTFVNEKEAENKQDQTQF